MNGLQESNLAARQPQGATSIIQAIMGEGLAQGPYVAARGGVRSTTFSTEGTDNLHLTNHAPYDNYALQPLETICTRLPRTIFHCKTEHCNQQNAKKIYNV